MKEEEVGGKVGKDRRDDEEEMYQATRRAQKTKHQKKGGCGTVERGGRWVKVEIVGYGSRRGHMRERKWVVEEIAGGGTRVRDISGGVDVVVVDEGEKEGW